MTEERFYMPVKVISGREAVREHASGLKGFGKKALIVTGRRSAKACGVYDDICAALEEAGIGHAWFHEVEENPSVTTVMEARDLGLREQADFVIGAGGGSAMDAAKAVALMIRHAEEDRAYLYQPGTDSSTVPVVCIPTTCGTGSEVTAVSVLTNDAKGVKGSIPHKIFPALSLIDGKYLRFAGRKVLCNTAFDALSHLYESFLNADATPLSRMIAESGMKEWSRCLCVLKGEKEAEDGDYAAMMRAAMLGGMAIAHTGTSLPHALSYALTCRLNVPHGNAVCYFMAGYLSEADPEEVSHILKLSGFSGVSDFNRTYLACCGGPEASEEELLSALEQSCREVIPNPSKRAKAPFAVSDELLRRIAFSGTASGKWRAVLFDLDGTINDSGPGIMNSVRYALKKMGYPAPEDAVLRKFVGPSLMYSFQTYCQMSEEEARQAVDAYRECYLAGECYNLRVYPGILKLLSDLKQAGIRCAVVTSKPQQTTERILAHMDILRLFDTVAGPDPDDPSNRKSVLIERALRDLELTAADVIMVGDSRYDIIGAKEAGCASAGVLYGYGSLEELRENGADHIVADPQALRSILLQ